MSLEDVIAANTAATNKLNENFAKLFAGKTGGETAAAATGTRPPGRPPTPKIAEVKAIGEQVSERFGKPAARQLIKDHGSDTIAAMETKQYAKFIAAAQAMLDEPDDSGEPADDDVEL